MRITFTLTLLFIAFYSLSQDSTNAKADTSNWKIEMIASLNGSQSAFRNWNAGGRNTIAIAGLYDFQAEYIEEKFKLKLGAGFAYGLSKIDDGFWRKTNDNIELYSDLSYDLVKNKLSTAFHLNFRTQFDKGYNYPNDSVYVSKFLAPGYLQAGLGINYSPVESLLVKVAPITGKFTFVNDQRLANKGAFGVEPAEFDDMGNLLQAGKKIRAEPGGLIKVRYSTEIMKNISLKTQLQLFSNYFNQPQNIDVNGEMLLNFKVNKWFQANLSVNLIYDDDIDIEVDENDDGIKDAQGPRTQLKEVLSLGISYTFKNKKKAD